MQPYEMFFVLSICCCIASYPFAFSLVFSALDQPFFGNARMTNFKLKLIFQRLEKTDKSSPKEYNSI